jgi:eukaryotic-like serine/threonine-protein kinase
MAHATTVTEFCATLSRSKLIPEAEVQALQLRWKQDTKSSESDLDGFRKYLISRKFLTDYQAAMIQRGHADGFMIGGYVIQDRIGKGQSAGVYKAVHGTGQVVALKVLPASRAKEPNVLNRFQREGRLLSQLDHPNAVRAYQVGNTGALYFIVMEFIEGETLEVVLNRRGRLPSDEAVRLIQQALFGLQHLHDKRLIHRDLKPANMMVTPAGGPEEDNTLNATLKILDIGIGREFFDEESTDTQDLMLTAEGTILGTPDYLAPEQARNARTADIRADIYSLGCVLFHLISGRAPFGDKTVMGQMIRHATDPIPRFASIGISVPLGLQEVLDKLTAKSIDDRYSTPAEAAEALVPFLPLDAVTANDSQILPAFREYLKSESDQEMPAIREESPHMEKLLPPVTMKIRDVQKLLAEAKAEAKIEIQPPAKQTGPVTGKIPRPSPIAPPPSPPISAPAKRDLDEIDVELVNLPPVPVMRQQPVQTVRVPEEPRSLFDPNLRDFIMIGVGAIGILLASGIGYGLARVLKPAPLSPNTAAIVEPESNK